MIVVIHIVVALRKESVDRNFHYATAENHCRVALRKESVDRNLKGGLLAGAGALSLSARRAWIEMHGMTAYALEIQDVALRKESVDRNAHFPCELRIGFCRRSPQGERG